MLKRAAKRATWLWNVARFTRLAAPSAPLAWPRLAIRCARICRAGRFTPREVYRLGLLRSTIRPTGPFPYISIKNLTKLQKALSPEPMIALARDKVMFFRYCQGLRIPMPDHYAFFYPNTVGWAADGTPLAGRDDWERFIATRLPEEFAAKPTAEASGKGFNIFTRSGVSEGHSRDPFGRDYSPAQLYDWLLAAAGRSGMILQQRLRNHPDLARLTGTDYLQTLKLLTLLDDRANCRILLGTFMLILDGGIVDNSRRPAHAGNPSAMVDLDTGRLVCGRFIPGTPDGIRTFANSPTTGLPIGGLQLPFWRESCEMVRKAAPAFWPLRTMGWDIALTPTGPLMTEGNTRYGPSNQHGGWPALVGELVKATGIKVPVAAGGIGSGSLT